VKIYIAGGHGKIALLLSRLLATAGHEPVGITRNAAHAVDIAATGATSVVLDLEAISVDEVAAVISDADAVVFAAGAGPGSSAERKLTVDRDGAILLADAAAKAGVQRYILVSAMSADDFDAASDDVFQIYLKAKSEADAAVRDRSFEWTVIRPGGLTNDPPTGTIAVAESTGRGTIPRADVAAVVVDVLVNGRAVRQQFELVSGDVEISEALAGL